MVVWTKIPESVPLLDEVAGWTWRHVEHDLKPMNYGPIHAMNVPIFASVYRRKRPRSMDQIDNALPPP